ncbi:MAG: hypothetical protein AB1710_08425 [Pseudomonadota bacterium]
MKDRLRRLHFNTLCAGILKTPPVAVDSGSRLAVLSQLQHKDVMMYLTALKSFALRVPVGEICVLNDGSLTQSDIGLLQEHAAGIRFLQLQDFRSARCPSGGTWERLLAIAELAKTRYVIQLDADTLTIGPASEINEFVHAGRAFTIGTWDKQTIETMQERCATAQALKPDAAAHVQVVAEANFDRLRGFQALRYVRGCSGFAGFPQDSFSKTFVEDISEQMSAAIGQKWHEWGSEQVMSNIVVANIPGAQVLPHPKYSDCQKMKLPETVFVHFIGSCRFDAGIYAGLAKEVIGALRA